MARSNKPIVWGPFAAGGTITAFLTPALVLVTLLAALGHLPDLLAYEQLLIDVEIFRRSDRLSDGIYTSTLEWLEVDLAAVGEGTDPAETPGNGRTGAPGAAR